MPTPVALGAAIALKMLLQKSKLERARLHKIE
jgi:hypothetical protein